MRAQVNQTFIFLSDEPPDEMLGDERAQAIEVRRDDDGGSDEHPISLVLGGVNIHMTVGVARELAERLAKAAR